MDLCEADYYKALSLEAFWHYIVFEAGVVHYGYALKKTATKESLDLYRDH